MVSWHYTVNVGVKLDQYTARVVFKSMHGYLNLKVCTGLNTLSQKTLDQSKTSELVFANNEDYICRKNIV